jgi:pimeloyl-ACP methyl ester carboxylesterase
MYYEATGAGEPLVLLHGGFGGVHLFGGQVPAFAERYRVLVPEQRGRGHTPDVEGPISYQLLADDIVAFLEQTVGEPAHLVGVSDGGVVGLLIAIARAELLRKLVTVGANFHGDGLLSIAMWTDASPDDEAWAGPRQRYAAVSPDGAEHFPVVFGKLQQMWRDGQPTLMAGDLAQIPIPVLVMAGDDDVIYHAHTVALYEALPHGQLAVIPGASHGVFMEKPALLNRIVLDFLAEQGDPQTLLPVRRANDGR